MWWQDNCTDDTAQVSRRRAPSCMSASTSTRRGRATPWITYSAPWPTRAGTQYDGYLIFDADNLVDPNFVSEMNKVFDSGNYGAITCYRNSRNFGANWISAGYAIWFLRRPASSTSPGCCWAATATFRAPASSSPPM